MRRVLASTAIASGAKAHEVQRLLRHSSGSTTMLIYAHAFRDAVDGAAASVAAAYSGAAAGLRAV